ncbi:MAG TPA: GtrA family protein [Burkholderiaceae bacterium]|nr:GtrA family protein [Rhodoferax sp.]HQZ05894.1 GtrA family protein [Burkholderiaceae bacterium]
MRHLLGYATVGVVATAVHYLLLIACVELAHWDAWLASGYGAAAGAQVAYLGNRWFTFAHRGNLPVSWLRFQLLALAGAALGMAIVALAVHLRMYYLLAQVLATVLVMGFTFTLNRVWTFR